MQLSYYTCRCLRLRVYLIYNPDMGPMLSIDSDYNELVYIYIYRNLYNNNSLDHAYSVADPGLEMGVARCIVGVASIFSRALCAH